MRQRTLQVIIIQLLAKCEKKNQSTHACPLQGLCCASKCMSCFYRSITDECMKKHASFLKEQNIPLVRAPLYAESIEKNRDEDGKDTGDQRHL